MEICIVANKDLRLNSRISRQIRSLTLAGHDVTLIAREAPLFQGLPQDSRVRCHAISKLNDPLALPRKIKALLFGVKKSPSHESPPTHGKANSKNLNKPLKALIRFLNFAGLSQNRLFARQALGKVRNEKFDVVQAHDDGAILAGNLIRSVCGGAFVFDAVELPHEELYLPQSPVAHALRMAEIADERKCIQSADAILTVSPSLVAHIVREFKVENTHLLRNCSLYIPPPGNSDIKDDIGLKSGEYLVLYLNSIWRGQGLEQLVEALSMMPDHVHAAVLGPEQEEGFIDRLNAQAARLGVGRRFHILPVKPVDRVIPYASGADLGIIPRQNDHMNLYYSLPNRVFEMIMARLPIACCGLPEIANLVASYGIGEIFDESSPEDIAGTLGEMLGPLKLETYRQALNRAVEELNWENESKSYLSLLEKLAARNRR